MIFEFQRSPNGFQIATETLRGAVGDSGASRGTYRMLWGRTEAPGCRRAILAKRRRSAIFQYPLQCNPSDHLQYV